MNRNSEKTVTFGEGQTYILDKYGFLTQPELWDENFANGMARLQSIYAGLTEEHWNFINYIRQKFLQENDLPLLVKACADNNLRLSRLKLLFPTGYFRGACRIAGLSFKFMCDTNIWHSYETVSLLKHDYKISEQGFLENFDDWDEHFANLVCGESKAPDGLTSVHWEIISFLRNYYLAMNNIPSVYEVCQAHNIDLNDLKELFPDGYRRGACRIAGLPFFA